MRIILLVFAHPDDETIMSGGTVAKYVHAGWKVDLVCATEGEAGSRGPLNASGQALGVIRQAELKAASDVLGINDTTVLGHADGGLAQLTPGTLEDPIYRAMESTLPDVVITFDQTGISNHPDHIKLCYATTYAYQKYAKWLASLQKEFRIRSSYDESWLKRLEGLRVKRVEPKLYYACMPESVVTYMQKVNALPNVSFGKPWVGVPDKFITTIIDIQKYKTIKLRALAEHVSQREDFEEEMAAANNPVFLKEYYILRMQGTKEHFMGRNDRISDRL